MTTPTAISSAPVLMPRSLRQTAIAVLVVGHLLVAACALADLDRFFANWLVLFVFAATIGMGALFLVALEYVVNARWSIPFRRLSEHLAGLIPVSLLLAIPVFLGMHHLYEWTHADVVAADPILAKKTAYLNIPFFAARFVLYYLIWLLFYRLFTRLSQEQDRTGDEALTWRGIKLAPPFIILFAFTMSFAAIDWMMSITPHWFSTMFGPSAAVGGIVGGLALLTLVSAQLKIQGMLPQRIGPDHFYNLGALLFGLNTLWTYMSFSEFMLIWYSNLPVEMTWYLQRQEHGWSLVTLLLVFCRFVIPFLALLSRPSKMNLNRLRWVSILLLATYGLHLYWVVLPGLPHLHGGPFSWMDLGFPLAAIGYGLFAWIWRSSRAALVAARDPRLESGLSFHL